MTSQCQTQLRSVGVYIKFHDDVIKWNNFPRYWPFVLGIHRSPVNSPHKGQRRGALIFSLICTRINGWLNDGEAGDFRRHRAHYDVTEMYCGRFDIDFTLGCEIPDSYVVQSRMCKPNLKLKTLNDIKIKIIPIPWQYEMLFYTKTQLYKILWTWTWVELFLHFPYFIRIYQAELGQLNVVIVYQKL